MSDENHELYLPQSVDTRETRRDLVPIEYVDFKPAAPVDSSRTAVTLAMPSMPSQVRTIPAMQSRNGGLDMIFGGGRDIAPDEFTDSFDIVCDGATDAEGRPLNPTTIGPQIVAVIPVRDAAEEEQRERNAVSYFDRHQQGVVQKMVDEGTFEAAMQADPLQLSDQRLQDAIPQRKVNDVGERRSERFRQREEQRRELKPERPTEGPSGGAEGGQLGGDDNR